MPLMGLTIGDLVQIALILVAVTGVVIRHGSRISSLEKEAEKQETTCNIRMDQVVSKELLNAKLDKIHSELTNVKQGQLGIFKKMDILNDRIMEVLSDRK